MSVSMDAVSFLERVLRPSEGCWEWTGTHSKGGYGQVWVPPSMLYTHRVAFELFVGPLVPGMDIDHLCGNPGCCNPAHLEQVTHQENIRRGRAATKTHCRNGHERVPSNLYIRKDGSRICRICTLDAQRRSRRGGSES